jgi:hypothetical protein
MKNKDTQGMIITGDHIKITLEDYEIKLGLSDDSSWLKFDSRIFNADIIGKIKNFAESAYKQGYADAALELMNKNNI